MSAFNAGLPQQKSAQVKQLGDIDFRPDCGTFINEPDKSILMRTGVIAPATQFPKAAKIDHLKVIGSVPTGVIPAIVNVTQWATNGSGTYVICHGSGANILLTTNWGQTWTAVSVSTPLSGLTPVAVVYTGARFIISGNSATTCYAAFSTDGLNWSAGGFVSSNISGATANSIRGAWNGSVALFVAGGDADAAFTTTNGAALTQVAVPAAMINPGLIFGGGKFLLFNTGSAVVYHSASGAGGWTTVGVPMTAGQAHWTNGVWVFWHSSPFVAYMTSNDLVTFTLRNFPFNQTAHAPQRLMGDSGRFYVSIKNGSPGNYGYPGIAYSVDGINWAMRYLIQGLSDGTSSWGCIDGRIFVPFCNPGITAISSASSLYTADFNVASYVGIPHAYYTDGAGSSAAPVAYVRIKQS